MKRQIIKAITKYSTVKEHTIIQNLISIIYNPLRATNGNIFFLRQYSMLEIFYTYCMQDTINTMEYKTEFYNTAGAIMAGVQLILIQGRMLCP
jgi:hypothetical protein